jgi:hypothetical protein
MKDNLFSSCSSAVSVMMQSLTQTMNVHNGALQRRISRHLFSLLIHRLKLKLLLKSSNSRKEESASITDVQQRNGSPNKGTI